LTYHRIYPETLIIILFVLSAFSGLPLIDIGFFSVTPIRAGLVVAIAGIFVFALQGNLRKIHSDFGLMVLFFLLAWIFYALFFSLFALDYVASLRQILALSINSFIIIATIFLLREKNSFSALVLPIFLVGFCLTAFGIAELVFDWHLPQSRYHEGSAYDGRDVVTATATFYNQNDFATFLSIFFAFSLSLSCYGHSRLIRYSATLSTVCAFFLIAAVLSRSNIIASIVIAIFFISMSSRRMIGVAVIAFVSAAVVWFSSLDNILSERIIRGYESLIFLFEASAYDSGSGGVRLNLAKNGFHFLGETWLLGVGPGNFEAWIAGRAVYPTGYITNAHSFWLELLVNYGLPIFLLFIFLYLFLIYRLYLIFRSASGDERPFLFGLLLALIGLVFAVQSSSSIFFSHWAWIIIGLAIARVQIERESACLRKGSRFQRALGSVPQGR